MFNSSYSNIISDKNYNFNIITPYTLDTIPNPFNISNK